MHYFGGKFRLHKEIVGVLNGFRKPDQLYVEPFVGGGWVMSKMLAPNRMAYDKHPYLISLYNKLKEGWQPPDKVTEEEYAKAKTGEYPDYLTGFIGFGCSYTGKWFGGYARDPKSDRNYCLNAKNSLLRKMSTMMDVTFLCSDYKDLNFDNALIYCDPPYAGTTQYGKIVGEFNTDDFWQKVREWSKTNTVIVSEYNAPADFKCIWTKATKTDIKDVNHRQIERTEKLFML